MTAHAHAPFLAALAVLALPGEPDAQTLVRDLNVLPVPAAGVEPEELVVVGSLVFFTGDFPDVGRELCVSDGTAGGTGYVIDFTPGLPGSDPRELTAFDGELFFTVATFDEGRELWRSDGTVAGTEMVVDLQPGPLGSAPTELTIFGGELYFRAFQSPMGTELFKTDGTAAGTVLVFDGQPAGISGSRPQNFTVVGSELFFSAQETATGRELWKTGGVPGDAVLVKNINLDQLDSNPSELTEHAGLLFFSAERLGDRELWVSDGTDAGTFEVADISTGDGDPRELVSFGSHLYFSGASNPIGRELWRSDGTAAGTELVLDIAPVGSSSPSDLLVHGGALWFAADDGASGRELWTSDGTAAGTSLALDLWPGPDGSNPTELSVWDGSLLFAADDGSAGTELWTGDGTPGGTMLLADLNGAGPSAPTSLTVDGTDLWFVADDGTSGPELFRSTGATTGLVADLVPSPTNAGSQPSSFTEWNGLLFFCADDGSTGRELWVSDGTDAGTVLLADVAPGTGSSNPRSFTEFDDRLYFVADLDGVLNGDAELWRTDGTPAGTELVIDVDPGVGSDPSELTVIGDALWFAADTLARGREPWILRRGTTSPTLVRDVNPGPGNSNPSEFTELDGLAWFVAFNPTTEEEIWSSDGTEEGTLPATDLSYGFNTGDPEHLAAFDGKLYFSADSASFGHELWSTDGTPAGTQQVVNLGTGGLSSFPARLQALGSRLLFTIGTQEDTLYSTDGTAAGTELVASSCDPDSFVRLGGLLVFTDEFGQSVFSTDGTAAGTLLLVDGVSNFSGAGLLTRAGDRVYFARGNYPGFSSVAETELWRTDGTVIGTEPVADTDPGDLLTLQSTVVDGIAAVGSGEEVLFLGNDYVHGTEVWLSDGVLGSETRLTDLAPGLANSDPASFVRAGDRIFFSADDGELGRELWSLPFDATGGYVLAPFGRGCAGTGGLVPRVTHGSLARIGNPLDLGLADAPPSTLAYLLFSPQRDLATVAGCTSYLGTPLFTIKQSLTDAAGSTGFSAPVQADPALVGVPLHFQWFVVDPAGPLFGLGTLSDALEVILGP